MNSRHKKKVFPVVVVAHDAGGAEIIAAYVRSHPHARYFAYADGPARTVFKRNGIEVTVAPKTRLGMAAIMKKHAGAAFALLGTGWMTDIEHNALLEANKAGIKTVVYLDSWMNYREVFGYPKKGWQRNLPDEFWAGDRAARALARKYFKGVPVRLVRNQYFADILRRFRALSRKREKGSDVLYMSAHGRISEVLLEDLLAELSKRKFTGTVRVRLHPADRRKTFQRIIDRSRGVRVDLSDEKDIVRDLLHARAVVGPETNALVPALLAGIRVVRIVPKKKDVFLPFTQMTLVTSAKSALRYLNASRQKSIQAKRLVV